MGGKSLSLIDNLIKALKNSNKNEKAQFMNQLLKEKELFEALKNAGLSPNVSDPQEKATQRPYGVLSKVQKIDEVDLIDLINKIVEITTVKTIETIQNLQNIEQIESATFKSNPIKNGCFRNGFKNWHVPQGCEIIDNPLFEKACKMTDVTVLWLTQYTAFKTNDYNTIVLWSASNETNLEYRISYTDGTTTQGIITLSQIWNCFTISLATDKIVKSLAFRCENNGTLALTGIEAI